MQGTEASWRMIAGRSVVWERLCLTWGQLEGRASAPRLLPRSMRMENECRKHWCKQAGKQQMR